MALAESEVEEISFQKVLDGSMRLDQLRISKEALVRQAATAREQGLEEMAGNFERAAELIEVPDGEVLRIYQLLRPGRGSKHDLLQAAQLLESRYGAKGAAGLLREAAEVYELRGLFR